MATRRRVIPTVSSSIPVTRRGIARGLLDFVEGAVTPMPLVGEANLLLGPQAQEQICILWVRRKGAPPTRGTTTFPALVRTQQRPPMAGERHLAGIAKPKLRRVGGVTMPQAILVGAST
jgi:hypothetical protein